MCGRVADRAHIGKGRGIESPVEEFADALLVEGVELAVQDEAMDVLDRLVDQQAEEDHRRARGREIVFAEELVLARAGLVHLEVAGKAEGALHGIRSSSCEVLGGEQLLLDVGPLG